MHYQLMVINNNKNLDKLLDGDICFLVFGYNEIQRDFLIKHLVMQLKLMGLLATFSVQIGAILKSLSANVS